MFWKKKNHKSVVQEVEAIAESFIPTVDIINASKVNYVSVMEGNSTIENEHLKKYLRILERNSPEDGRPFNVSFVEGAKKAGFNLFVNPDVVAGFKYAALVVEEGHMKLSHVIDGIREVFYTGDIPEFALERIEKAKKFEGDTFTIHSNQELTVRYEPFIYRDPVIIKWDNSICVEKEKGVWVCNPYTQSHPICVGCVVAMWQDDGQPL